MTPTMKEILAAKKKSGWKSLIMFCWDDVYEIIREPSINESQFFSRVYEVNPGEAADIIIEELHVDSNFNIREEAAAGFIHSVCQHINKWAEQSIEKINSMIDSERVRLTDLVGLVTSHIIAVDPKFPSEDIGSMTFSDLFKRLFAIERTLESTSGGKTQPFKLVTEEMITRERIKEEKAKIDKIIAEAEPDSGPIEAPPTEAEVVKLATASHLSQIKLVKPKVTIEEVPTKKRKVFE